MNAFLNSSQNFYDLSRLALPDFVYRTCAAKHRVRCCQPALNFALLHYRSEHLLDLLCVLLNSQMRRRQAIADESTQRGAGRLAKSKGMFAAHAGD